ncbi:MAG: glutamine synthetase III [Fibrobacteres bacterium]|nr:glutamine synthetase III [Fibrobacterota bacterium]
MEAIGNLSEKFGTNAFGRETMRRYVPKEVFEKYLATVQAGEPLDPKISGAIANGMKEWAMEKGATHFTHWFQPMTGLTAEKHDAFIDFIGEGEVLERFSGKQLVQGEPDASSFPSGGLRATFEARGYTIWDPTSPAFIMDGANGKTLCIPSIFMSYSGHSLGQKEPLLKSLAAAEKSALRVLKLFGNTSKRTKVTVGGEQEYFLIDLKFYNQRPDLIMAGRSLFGASSPKGQQMEDHYFGSIKSRVLSFMQEVDEELIKLGVPVKTRHNEVAPNQFEIAPIFEEAAVATDHNQITMEILRKVAAKHSLALLLHEKPFAGVNGSGKHNNWSMSDEFGNNLLEPGQTPEKNLQFLVFILACLRALKNHGHLLRASVATAGNDHRLGANEAPPAIMSAFIGEQLMDVFDHIENETSSSKAKNELFDHGLSKLPEIKKDATDRNRTSPFAFTGNKFEFRAVGSSANLSTPNVVLNTIIAESLDVIADRIEAKMRAEGDFKKAALAVIRETITEVRPVVFNGDNYSEEWHKEAEKRGLYNDRTTPSALKHLVSKETIALFTKYAVLAEDEVKSRYHINLEAYIKTIGIEAGLVKEIAQTMIVPAAFKYLNTVSGSVSTLTVAGLSKEALEPSLEIANELLELVSSVKKGCRELDKALEKAAKMHDEQACAEEYCSKVIPAMLKVRAVADKLETICDDSAWPLPKYREMLFLI